MEKHLFSEDVLTSTFDGCTHIVFRLFTKIELDLKSFFLPRTMHLYIQFVNIKISTSLMRHTVNELHLKLQNLFRRNDKDSTTYDFQSNQRILRLLISFDILWNFMTFSSITHTCPRNFCCITFRLFHSS